jgi:hypothetical protein
MLPNCYPDCSKIALSGTFFRCSQVIMSLGLSSSIRNKKNLPQSRGKRIISESSWAHFLRLRRKKLRLAGGSAAARPMATCGGPAPPEANPQDLRPLAHVAVAAPGDHTCTTHGVLRNKTPIVITADESLRRMYTVAADYRIKIGSSTIAMFRKSVNGFPLSTVRRLRQMATLITLIPFCSSGALSCEPAQLIM